MFTGIIEQQGIVTALQRGAGGRIVIRAPELAPHLRVAGSIAVNGCCLTVVQRSNDEFAADLSPETLERTTFGGMHAQARVNLERPLRAGAEFGGHFVQGHVDAVGRVLRLIPEGSRTQRQKRAAPHGQAETSWWLEIDLPSTVVPYVAAKGSLAVDGISLTVAEVTDGRAAFAIIPYTYAHTNVVHLHPGDGVNLEADILAKYVEQLMKARGALDAKRAPSRKR